MSRKRKKLSTGPAADGNRRNTNVAQSSAGRDKPPHNQRKPARENGLWLYGWHACLAALGNPQRRCRQLLLAGTADVNHQAALDALYNRHDLSLPESQTIDREQMSERLPPGAVHQGIALRVDPLPLQDLEDVLEDLPTGRQVIVALDQVSDPHNVGAILRSAAIFGGAAVLNTERHAPAETGTLAKSASGGLESVPYIQVINLARSLDRLKEAGFWVFGLASEAPATLPEAELPEKLVLCLGAEGPGLRRLTRERCDLLVRLPAPGPLQDLNVSNAAAVALYELLART